jgi:hypothetical protein
MIDAAKVIMESVRTHAGTDSVFYEKSGEVLKRADQKVAPCLSLSLLLVFISALLPHKSFHFWLTFLLPSFRYFFFLFLSFFNSLSFYHTASFLYTCLSSIS